MAISAAVSAASYTKVMADTMAALGLSTIVPAAIVALMDAAHGAADVAARDAAADLEAASAPGLFDQLIPGQAAARDNRAKANARFLARLAAGRDNVDLLVPKTAKIHTEFEFNAQEEFAAGVSVGTNMNIVTVSAGWHALYSASSSNRITMDIDFATVNYQFT